MNTPFDRALEDRALRSAATEFALRHGQPGSAEYRSAWLRYRREAGTPEDLGAGGGRAPNGVERRRSRGLKRRELVREILDATIEHAMQLDAATMANAQLLDTRTRALRLAAHRGFSAEFLDFFKIVYDTTTACGSALECGRPILISDITTSSVFARTAGLQVMLRAGSRAVASLPVRAPNGQVVAMISIHHSQTSTWTDRRMLALEALCDSAGHLLYHLLGGPRPPRPPSA